MSFLFRFFNKSNIDTDYVNRMFFSDDITKEIYIDLITLEKRICCDYVNKYNSSKMTNTTVWFINDILADRIRDIEKKALLAKMAWDLHLDRSFTTIASSNDVDTIKKNCLRYNMKTHEELLKIAQIILTKGE